jgi:NADH pyrophosphatase NudC (nudix superfamily)
VTIWIAGILLITAVALFVAAPLTEHRTGIFESTSGRERQSLDHEHALAVQGLRELEFDRAMGKLDTDDYHILRQRLEARALIAMRSIERKAGSLASSSQAVSAKPRATAERVNFCPQCGARFKPTYNFCPNCAPPRSTIASYNG